MGHPRRYFENNCAYFITNRLASGLPFVPCKYINNVLTGILAKASNKYPDITICHYLWMRNHYHLLIVTNGNPGDIAGFMNILNGEIGKAVAKWLRKRNVKIWAQRYNCIRLLTPDVVVEKITYLYLNPVKDDFVDKSCRWPGISSYGIEQEQVITGEYLSPRKLIRLPNQRLSKEIGKQLLEQSPKGKSYDFILKPYAWVSCFEDAEQEDFYKAQIADKISSDEKKYEEARKLPVMGTLEVKTQNPHQFYIPENKGKRMFCMSSCLELRKQFIELYQDFCEKCNTVWRNWKEGLFQYKYPPAAFIPPLWPLSNTLKFQT